MRFNCRGSIGEPQPRISHAGFLTMRAHSDDRTTRHRGHAIQRPAAQAIFESTTVGGGLREACRGCRLHLHSCHPRTTRAGLPKLPGGRQHQDKAR